MLRFFDDRKPGRGLCGAGGCVDDRLQVGNGGQPKFGELGTITRHVEHIEHRRDFRAAAGGPHVWGSGLWQLHWEERIA